MRNPIRLKNLRLRLLPLYAAGLALLLFARPTGAGYGCGLALLSAGAVLRGWGAGHLLKTEALTVTGPYAHLRHPLYLGTLLIGVGVLSMAGGVWALALLALFLPWFFLGYFPRKERSESQRLEALYGEAFRAYREAVPALWPRLSPWRPPGGPGVAGRWSLERYSDNNELGTLLGVLALAVAFGLRTAWMASA